MAEDLLQTMVAQARAKNGHELLVAWGRVDVAAWPKDDILVAALQVKEAGYPEVAADILERLLQAYPDDAAGHYELGVVFRYNGRPKRAADHFREARRCAPGDFNYGLNLAHMYFAMGAWQEAEEALAALPATSPQQEAQARVMRQFGLYLLNHSRGRAKYLIDEVKRRYGWMEPPDVADAIAAAVRERRGFALIRLGDGEGAFAEVDAVDEARYADLYGALRKEWTEFLFGPEFDPVLTGYESTRRALMPVVTEADVLGVPYPTWVDHEYNISSVRGVPCTLNVHRNLLANPPARAPKLCDQIVHIHLHNQNSIEPILRAARGITVVTCLTGLPDRLKQRFRLEDVDVLTVPAEYTAPHLSGRADAVTGAHYPTVFWNVMEQLARPWDGRVFLVAAGTLGKYYAIQIKRHGGVALDLGSLVDGWMRLQSRAGYGESLAL
jgi:tetratricopeptide (TPR) repeat protein